ncbi:MAG: preprotein translocase subunit SecG [Prevotella sp.]|jgi:preprotein translocase subunit SecG|nr:preprotein translocase subunit SecG [Prevotella sp.]
MYTLFVILIVIAAVLMIGIVLIQESKGGGLSSSFAGYNQVAGVRKTTDFIEKATWALAAAMVVISVICAWVAPTATADSSVMENIENPVTNPNNLPGFGASQQNNAAAPAQDAAAAPAAATDSTKK